MSLSEARIFRSLTADPFETLVKGLIDQLGAYMESDTLDQVRDALQYGAWAHEGQTRKSGEAYISHPVAVARILGGMRMDSRTIIAAILHDVVEDTPVTAEELSERFGEDVALLVDGVSKVSQLEFDSRQTAEVASFRKMFMAMARDIRVIIIKLCDRLHNMRTLGSLDDGRRQRIARQTLEIYAPIANRLGMRELSVELEDLAFKNLYPKRYSAIEKMVRTSKRGRKSIIDKACVEIESALAHNKITADVEGREKNFYSIYRKALSRQKIEFTDVVDINALRIIVPSRNQCYLALGVVHKLFQPRPATFKDYIAIEKTNGYQSLHTSVVGPYGATVEVQIRSRSMHRVAESGVASHWLYKTDVAGDSAPQQLAQRWLSSFIESEKMSGDSGEFIEHLKADLYPDEVYVFTPKGAIKRLPRDATAIDFAYAVHSDLGNRTVGARINQKAVPLFEKLRNGDRVEIITATRSQPEPGWLNFAVTSKARSAIRHFLNNQMGRESLRLGQKLLRKSLRDHGYKRYRIPSDHKLKLLNALDLPDWSELLSEIGLGKRLAPLVAKQLINEADGSERQVKLPRPAKDRHNPHNITIEGTEGLLVNYAKCCCPIPDDRIIGTTTADRGIVIHRLRCPNSRGVMKHPDRFYNLNWANDTHGVFEAKITLESRNEPGVLSEVTNTIASHKSNINKLSVDEDAGNLSRMSFVIEVQNRKHLADILRDLHTLGPVTRVHRVR